jgi:hypothetical protein
MNHISVLSVYMWPVVIVENSIVVFITKLRQRSIGIAWVRGCVRRTGQIRGILSSMRQMYLRTLKVIISVTSLV